MDKVNCRQTIGIIGTGNFAMAFAHRLLQSGYGVVFGSRKPTECNFSSELACCCNVTVTSIEACITTANICVLAVHQKHARDTLSPYVDKLAGKICIDVSNRKCLSKGPSYSEQLQKLLSHSVVVKAFNVISAYEMESNTSGGSKLVYIASDDTDTRSKIAELTRDLGFIPKDYGILKNARKIEKIPLQLFPEWKQPLGFTLLVFILWYLYAIFIYFVETTSYSWEQIFVKVTNKPLCMTAITVLACTYLPSSIAAFFQIYYGTKRIRFPKWLDLWLRTRKQLGLIVFVLSFIHVIMSVLTMSPTYLKSWYHSTEIVIPRNISVDLILPMRTWMTWKGEAACLVGILAFTGMCILAVTSIRSVGDYLNWREWHCIQSTLGHVVLFLSLSHVIVMGAPGWISGGPYKTIRSITFLCSILPMITLIFKIVCCLPIIKGYIKKIRFGWERRQTPCKAKCSGFEGKILNTHYTKLEIGNGIDKEDFGENIELDNCQCSATKIV